MGGRVRDGDDDGIRPLSAGRGAVAAGQDFTDLGHRLHPGRDLIYRQPLVGQGQLMGVAIMT